MMMKIVLLAACLIAAPAAQAFETSITVSADTAAGVSNYKVQVGIPSGTAVIWSDAGTVTTLPAPVKITWDGPQVERRQVRVQACNASGCSNWTPPVSFVLTSLSIAPPFSGDKLPIVIEAEHPHVFAAYQHHAWDIVAAPAGFFGSGVVQVLPSDGATPLTTTANNPMMGYKVRLAAGNYTVWLRATAKGGTDDSVWVGLDDKILGSVANYRAYGWVKLATLATVVTTGDHVINLYMREAGTVVDTILLTTDPAYVPPATALAESERVGAVPGMPSGLKVAW